MYFSSAILAVETDALLLNYRPCCFFKFLKVTCRSDRDGVQQHRLIESIQHHRFVAGVADLRAIIHRDRTFVAAAIACLDVHSARTLSWHCPVMFVCTK